MSQIEVLMEKLANAEGLPIPERMSEYAAGMDLYAAIDARQAICLKPLQRCLVPTGIKIALPPGYEAQVRPRSGIALNHGVTVLNTPGTIDADYRGEIKVILINLGEENFNIRRGDRIAQMIINALPDIKLKQMDKLPSSKRDESGFGHTGIK